MSDFVSMVNDVFTGLDRRVKALEAKAKPVEKPRRMQANKAVGSPHRVEHEEEDECS